MANSGLGLMSNGARPLMTQFSESPAMPTGQKLGDLRGLGEGGSEQTASHDHGSQRLKVRMLADRIEVGF
jgi:hypothetical protein